MKDKVHHDTMYSLIIRSMITQYFVVSEMRLVRKSISEAKPETLLPSKERRSINTCTNNINSDSSVGKYVHLSNNLIQGYGHYCMFVVMIIMLRSL